MSPLVVVALRREATRLAGVDVLLTGIGKVSAAMTLSAALAERRPSRVLNVGTAGALHDGLEGTHRIGRVVEHDLDHVALGALIGEPVPGDIVLDPSEPIVLATGDTFVQDPGVRRALAGRAHLVDMEGYAVARVCESFGVPCEIVKVVSDDASSAAATTWQAGVDRTARMIAEAVDRYLR